MARAKRVDLTEHAVVESQLRPHLAHLSPATAEQHARHLEDRTRPRQDPVRVRGALAHRGSVTARVVTQPGQHVDVPVDHFAEVPHSCPCGEELHAEADRVPGAWAEHVAKLAGLEPEAIARHMLAALRSQGDHPVAHCRCGQEFESDGYLPDPAIRAWAEHALAAAR